MLKLIRRGSNRYMVVIEEIAFVEEYDLDGAIDMMRYLAVADEEIEAAITSLVQNDHFVAEFGFFNTFLYSRAASAPVSQVA